VYGSGRRPGTSFDDDDDDDASSLLQTHGTTVGSVVTTVDRGSSDGVPMVGRSFSRSVGRSLPFVPFLPSFLGPAVPL
jgi:hypothetical protein